MKNKKEIMKQDIEQTSSKNSSTPKNVDKKTAKALAKQKQGKDLSKKEQDRINLINTKYRYKQNKDYALRLKNVKRNFGTKQVLKGVTFDIKKGERVSLIGKNGSGKSTLINIISQQLKMSRGDILYGYASSRVESLELMGIQFQTLNYPEGFVVGDVIHFFNVSVEKSIRMSKRELSDMVFMFGIDKYIDQKIDRLSGGQQQRVNILLALIKRPKLLILDEISTGLDVESAETIKDYIDMYLKKNPETALLLVSHSDEEIREMTTRAYVLEAGKIVEEFPSTELTPERFLEITSREPKLSKKDQDALEKDSNRYLKSLERSYRVKKVKEDKEVKPTLSEKIAKKFSYIDNSKLAEGNAVEVRDISKTYDGRVGAVRQLSLDIKQGERVAITGPNGSGKSTIVEIIAQVKNADNQKDKYKNMLSLAEVDFKREEKLIEENIAVELRKFKNQYRLHRDLVNLEINDLKANLNKELKSARNEAMKARKNNDTTIEVKLEMKKASDNRRKQIEDNIVKLESELKVYIEKQHAKYDRLEKELNGQLESKKAQELLKYHSRVQQIHNEMDEVKKQKGLTHSKEYIHNGELIEASSYILDRPQLSYSFADTSRKVKDNSGVQFQYASFPVEMSVQDVILFFARSNKYYMTKEEILDAVKVFKLEKLLKAKAYRLSGGERQRLNVLLSIMKSPKLLILDEISTGLDVDSILKIDHFIKAYLDRTGATLILISHNYNEVKSLTDKIVVMRYGELSEIVDTKGWSLLKVKAKMRDIYKGGGI